jgi:hypothetical protein
MSAGMVFVLWKGFLGFVLPIAVGLWELRQLRRYREEDEPAAAASTLPRRDGHSAVPDPARARPAAKVPELV